MDNTTASSNPFFASYLRFAVAALVFGALACLMEPVFLGRAEETGSLASSRLFDVFAGLSFFWLGSILGSFLNVLVYRVPRGITMMGVSHCPQCMNRIAPRDNVPIFAWLMLQGRCRDCRSSISVRYPMVEFAAALLMLTLAVVELALGGANLSISSTRPFCGFIYQLDPDWPLVIALMWHTGVGLLLLTLALIVHDGSRLPKRLVGAGFLGVIAIAFCHPSTLYAVRHMPADVTTWLALRDASLAALAGWAVGLLYGIDEWLSGAKQKAGYRNVAMLLALVGAALGWPAVLFCGIATPILELVCRSVAKAAVSPALILTSVILFYLISGFPLLFPYLHLMPL